MGIATRNGSIIDETNDKFQSQLVKKIFVKANKYVHLKNWCLGKITKLLLCTFCFKNLCFLLKLLNKRYILLFYFLAFSISIDVMLYYITFYSFHSIEMLILGRRQLIKCYCSLKMTLFSKIVRKERHQEDIG